MHRLQGGLKQIDGKKKGDVVRTNMLFLFGCILIGYAQCTPRILRYGDIIQLKSVLAAKPLYPIIDANTQKLYSVICFDASYLDNWWIVKAGRNQDINQLLGKQVMTGAKIRLEHVMNRAYVRPNMTAVQGISRQMQQVPSIPIVATNRGPGFLNYEQSGSDDVNSDWIVEKIGVGDGLEEGAVIRLKHNSLPYYLAVTTQTSALKAGSSSIDAYGVIGVLPVKGDSAQSANTMRMQWKISSVFSLPDLRMVQSTDQKNASGSSSAKDQTARTIILAAFPDRDVPQFVYTGTTDKQGVFAGLTQAYSDDSTKLYFPHKADLIHLNLNRKEGIVGFYAPATQGAMKSTSHFEVFFSGGNFASSIDQYWWPSPDLQHNGFLKFMHQTTKGFLTYSSKPWGLSRLWTTASQKIPATENEGIGFLVLDNKTFDLPGQSLDLGKKSITYDPGLHSPLGMLFHEQWKLPDPASGIVQFSAKAQDSICCSFSSRPLVQVQNMYHLTIGGKGNSTVTLRKGIYGKILDAKDPPAPWATVLQRTDLGKSHKGQKPIMGGYPDSGAVMNDYWIKINGNVISFGIGKDITHENTWFWWQDDELLEFVQYVGFAGFGSMVFFDNISIKPLPADEKKVPVTTETLAAKKFKPMSGSMLKLAVGAREGSLLIIGIGKDGFLYEYNKTKDAWTKKITKDSKGVILQNFTSCVLTTDGMLSAAAGGHVYNYDWQSDVWTILDNTILLQNASAQRKSSSKQSSAAVKFAQKIEDGALVVSSIGMARKQVLWGLDVSNKRIYERQPDGWIERANRGVALSVGFDGTVVALNDAGKPYRYDTIQAVWIPISDQFAQASPNQSIPIVLEKIAVQGSNVMYAITHDMEFVSYDGPSKAWKAMNDDQGNPLKNIADCFVNAAGTLCIITKAGFMYRAGEEGVSPQAYALVLTASPPPVQNSGFGANTTLQSTNQGMMK